MLSETNIKELNLTEEQLRKYRYFEDREKALRNILKECKVNLNAVEGIIKKSNLNKVDLNNLDALKESVKEEWSDFIIMKK